MHWFCEMTGWSTYKSSRLCRLKLVPGAYNSQVGVRGSKWWFRKDITTAWFQNLIIK